MPSRLEAHFSERLRDGGKLMIPFLTGGYPDVPRFLRAMRAVAEYGADAIEVGIPFSDPLADGPTIQRTSQRSLEQGITLAKLLDLLEAARSEPGAPELPIVLMSYANPILRMGEREFCRRAARAGVQGVLVSDLPPGERPSLEEELGSHGLDRILLIAPTTRPDRCERLASLASGFVYCVTRTGVTGAGADFSSLLAEQVARIRSRTDLAVVAGFGIRTGADVAKLRDLVDGVVIGARLLEEIARAETAEGIDPLVEAFLGDIRAHLDAR
jgi:tryptophan synthase alpha chain